MSTIGEDIHLNEYGKVLSSDIIIRVQIEHQFLPLEEEARLEQNSFFVKNRIHNQQVLSNLCSILDISPSICDIEKVVIVSVGTSSTQVFCNEGVVCARYIGHGSLIESPELAAELFTYIFDEIRKQGLTTECLILSNAIGYITNKHLLLNNSQESLESFSNQSNLIEAQERGNETEIKKEEYEFQQQGKLLAVFANAAASPLINPTNVCIVLQSRQSPKFKYGWLESRALQLLNNQIASCNGIYVVDFGGGGPVLSYCSRQKSTLDPISKDRSFRKAQQEFISAMSHRNLEESPLFTHLVKFLKKNILLHFLNTESENDLVESVAGVAVGEDVDGVSSIGNMKRSSINSVVDGDSVEPVSLSNNDTGSALVTTTAINTSNETVLICYVLQTGKARQQHFLGHYRPVI